MKLISIDVDYFEGVSYEVRILKAKILSVFFGLCGQRLGGHPIKNPKERNRTIRKSKILLFIYTGMDLGDDYEVWRDWIDQNNFYEKFFTEENLDLYHSRLRDKNEELTELEDVHIE